MVVEPTKIGYLKDLRHFRKKDFKSVAAENAFKLLSHSVHVLILLVLHWGLNKLFLNYHWVYSYLLIKQAADIQKNNLI